MWNRHVDMERYIWGDGTDYWYYKITTAFIHTVGIIHSWACGFDTTLKFSCISGILVCFLLHKMGMEVLECHSTWSDGSQRVKPTRFVCICASVLSLMLVMALVGAGKALAVACHLADVIHTASSSALYEKVWSIMQWRTKNTAVGKSVTHDAMADKVHKQEVPCTHCDMHSITWHAHYSTTIPTISVAVARQLAIYCYLWKDALYKLSVIQVLYSCYKHAYNRNNNL